MTNTNDYCLNTQRIQHYSHPTNDVFKPVPDSVRCKAWVCGHSLAAVVGSNSAGGIDVTRECCVLSGFLRRADNPFYTSCVGNPHRGPHAMLKESYQISTDN